MTAGTQLWCNVDFDTVQRVEAYHGTAAVYSHRAPGKERANEDSVAVFAYPDDSLVLAVADGLGGMPAGGDASRLVLETLAEWLRRSGAENIPVTDAIVPAIQGANQSLVDGARGNATTLALVTIRGRAVRAIHAGDSGILVIGQRRKIKLQTMFHSPTGYAQEAGILSEAEALNHPWRHIVSNVAGSAAMRLEVGPEIVLADRDTVVVASDGLFDNLYTEEIVDTVRKGPLEDALTKLVSAATSRMDGWLGDQQHGVPGHPDDLTVILFRRSRP